jgi:hypothetical protein
MDVQTARACVQLLSDLQGAGVLAGLAMHHAKQDWRKQQIQLGPGWVPLVGEMLDGLLALPQREQPPIKYIRTLGGALDVSWGGDSPEADSIIASATAESVHLCEYCGARGRLQKTAGQERILCRTHGDLAHRGALDDYPVADLVRKGLGFPRRRMLVGLTIGGQTESGCRAALLSRSGEEGFAMDSVHFLAAWLTGTAKHADLHAVDAHHLGQLLDFGVFSWLGRGRTFDIHEAKPALQAAAKRRGEDPRFLERLFCDVRHHDPEVRAPAFVHLAQWLDEPEEQT